MAVAQRRIKRLIGAWGIAVARKSGFFVSYAQETSALAPICLGRVGDSGRVEGVLRRMTGDSGRAKRGIAVARMGDSGRAKTPRSLPASGLAGRPIAFPYPFIHKRRPRKRKSRKNPRLPSYIHVVALPALRAAFARASVPALQSVWPTASSKSLFAAYAAKTKAVSTREGAEWRFKVHAATKQS